MSLTLSKIFLFQKQQSCVCSLCRMTKIFAKSVTVARKSDDLSCKQLCACVRVVSFKVEAGVQGCMEVIIC